MDYHTAETRTVVRQISIHYVLFGRNGHLWIWTKVEKYCPDPYQSRSKNPGSVMVCGCISAPSKAHSHLCDGSIHPEKYTDTLEQHVLPSTTTSFLGKSMHFLTR